MPHSEDTQPGPAWCLATDDHDGIAYVCTYKAQHVGRHKMVKQSDMRAELRDAMDAMTGADLVDRDDTAELTATDPSTVTDIINANRVRRVAGLAERKRHAELIAYESGTGLDIVDDIFALDQERWSNNLPADRESLLRIEKRIMAWVLQAGTREDGGS